MLADLTPKQREFVRQYLLTRNGSEAVRNAGYKTKWPDKIASQLLGNTRVFAAISAGEQKVQEKFEITQESIIRELALVGFGNLSDVIDDEGNIKHEGKAAFLSSVSKSSTSHSNEQGSSESNSFSFSTQNKVKALELLGKHVGMWKDGQKPIDLGDKQTILSRLSKHLSKRTKE